MFPLKTKAFTLIEILMVVLLLGVIAGFAIPNFSGTFSDFQLSETAKNIASLMRYAQGRAITKSKEQKINFDFQGGQYWLEEKVGDANEDTNANEAEGAPTFERITGRYGRVFFIPSEVMAESDNSAVCFYPDGKIDKARVYLHNKRESYFTVSTQEQAGDVQVFDFKTE